MSQLSPRLRDSEGEGLSFWCPGCNDSHRIQHGFGPGPRWVWNGNVNKPTFTPSVLVRNGHYLPEHTSEECWCSYNVKHPGDTDTFVCCLCHSYVTDGRIKFLDDSTHALAGQTVDLPEWPSHG